MRQALIVRCAFETMLGSISARGSNPIDVGAASDEADDLISFLRFWECPETNVAHRSTPRSTNQCVNCGDLGRPPIRLR